MKVKQSTKEVLVQAQMFRLKTNSGNVLCLEHIYYALLLMACYLDEPMNNPEFRDEAVELRAFLKKHLKSVAVTKKAMQMSANSEKNRKTPLFRDANTMLGRAVEIAGNDPISPLNLAQAILENPSELILRHNTAVSEITALNAEEDKYSDTDNSGVIIAAASSLSQDVDLQIMKQKEEEERKRREKEEQERKEKEAAERRRREKEEQERKEKEAAERRRREKEERERKEKEEAERKKREARERLEKMGLFAAFQEFDRNEKKEQKKQKPLYTFIGPFEFKGSTFWGYLQYFLWGLVIVAGGLFALEHFTGYVKNPPSQWAAFGVSAFCLAGIYYMLRGITYFLELHTPALAMFSRLIFDLCLIGTLMTAYIRDFGLETYPRWLKYVGGVLAVVVLSVGVILYNGLYYKPEIRKKSIKYVNNEGPVGKVFLQTLTSQLVFPIALAIGIWAYPKVFKVWHIKVFYLAYFIIIWNLVYTLLVCLALKARARWYRGKLGGLYRFAHMFYVFLFIPLLVFFLHWLFGWFPMKLWVKIVLGIYTFITFIVSIAGLRN